MPAKGRRDSDGLLLFRCASTWPAALKMRPFAADIPWAFPSSAAMSKPPPSSRPTRLSKPRGGLVGLVRKLLFGHLRLTRLEGRWRLVLEDRDAPGAVDAAPPTLAPVNAPPTDAEAAAQRAALKALLDVNRDTRHALPHLRYLESALARQGARAIPETPAHVLKKILLQLDGLNDIAHPALLQLQERVSIQLERETERKTERADAA